MFDDTDSVVIHPDLPRDFEPMSAVMVRRYPWRADVVKWLRPNALNIGSRAALGRLKSELSDAASSHDGAVFLGAVKILHEPLSFEFPDNFADLVTALSTQQVSRAELLDQLAQVWMANMLTAESPNTPAPLHVVIGAPMRGFAGADVPDTHLEVWQMDPADALAAPILTLTDDAGDADLAAWLPAARATAQEWMRTAPLAWAYVQEDRRRIVTRRDVGRPAQWLLGKNVLVLGCTRLPGRPAVFSSDISMTRARVVWVSAAAGPSTDSERGEHFFRHGTDGVAARISAYRDRTGGRARFVGMWHTHPGLSAQASLIDDQAMENLFVPVAATRFPRRKIIGRTEHIAASCASQKTREIGSAPRTEQGSAPAPHRPTFLSPCSGMFRTSVIAATSRTHTVKS